jgi:hypothetical protein
MGDTDSYFKYDRNLVNTIVNGEDPIDVLASRLMDVMTDDENFQHTVHILVCQDMDIPNDTVIGFTAEEAKEAGLEHYLPEDDPRYALYWETLSNLWNQLFAHCISKARYRWTKEFTAKRRQTYGIADPDQEATSE